MTRAHVAEEKLDGHRALIHFGGGLRRVYVTGLRVSKKTGRLTEKGESLPQFSFFHADSGKLPRTVLDGELQLPGQTFEQIQSVLGCLPERAVERQKELGWMRFTAFDILHLDGVEVGSRPQRARAELLRGALMRHQSEHLHRVRAWNCFNELESKVVFDRIVEEGGEGVVLKDPNKPYGSGWKKWKKEDTFDVVIVGFEQGCGKFEELIGAVRFGAYDDKGQLIEIGQCSGMGDGIANWVHRVTGVAVAPNSSDDAILRLPPDVTQPMGSRGWFTERQGMLLGKVIEVTCKGVTAKGRLRHPQFGRMRPDKGAKQCLLPVVRKDGE